MSKIDTPFISKVREHRVALLAGVIRTTGSQDKDLVAKTLVANYQINLASFVERCSAKRYDGMIKRAINYNERGNN